MKQKLITTLLILAVYVIIYTLEQNGILFTHPVTFGALFRITLAYMGITILMDWK